jgi:hypothetical protein
MAMKPRTKNATATELMTMLAAAEKAADDMRLMLSLIAFNQPDKIFTVSIPELTALPQGSSIDISFNKSTQEYEFKYVSPDAPPLEEPALIEVPFSKTPT